MVAIYKHKGLREDCGNYRGIALLITVGKILAGILLKRLNEIAEQVCLNPNVAFVPADMIFTARQMQEKCR